MVTQYAWRPGPGTDAGPQAAVSTAGGMLLLGKLGEELSVAKVADGPVTCLAWSPDGSLLAAGHGPTVTVRQLDTGSEFMAEISSQVRFCGWQYWGSKFLHMSLGGCTTGHGSGCHGAAGRQPGIYRQQQNLCWQQSGSPRGRAQRPGGALTPPATSAFGRQ